jgi:putative thiamine transport system permease protein
MPVAVGLLGAILPALGWFPPLGRDHFSFRPFVDFFAQPGLRRSLYLSLSVGLLATFLSYWLAMFLLAILYGQGTRRVFVQTDIAALICSAYYHCGWVLIPFTAQWLVITAVLAMAYWLAASP